MQRRKTLAPRVLAINALLHSLILLFLLQPSVLWLSIVTFNIVTGLADRATRLGGLPHLSGLRHQPGGPPPPCKQALTQYEEPWLNKLSRLRFCSIAYVWGEAKRCPELLTVADPDLQIRGEGVVIQTLRKGRGDSIKKKIYRPFGPQFGLKIKEGPGRAPSLNPPLINTEVRGIYTTTIPLFALYLITYMKEKNINVYIFICT